MQLIEFYDTKTKTLRALTPINGKRVLIYSCGPTLYQPAHIGNMRAYVFADTLNRTLRCFGYKPKHVINFTDVGHLTDDADAGEDKVEKQAAQENQSAEAITKRFGELFLADLKKLNINPRRYLFPRATEHVAEQIALTQTLEQKGYTYAIDDGIYFDTRAYKEYGALGLPNNDDTNDYARIQQVSGKKHPQDFALWKRTPQGVTRQQEWDSPWGRGFPGWHIECSAMAMKILGSTIDIHSGGIDHITVHHNNEIAQSEGATGEVFANLWVHVAFLTMRSEKLSKSLGNTYTVGDLEQRKYNPLALRYLLLQGSYRTPLSFSFDALDAAQTALQRLQKEYNTLPRTLFSRFDTTRDEAYCAKVDAAIASDLNTAKVLAVMWDIVHDTTLTPLVKRNTLQYADRLLGILSCRSTVKSQEMISPEVRELLVKRTAARVNKDYATSDALREQIQNLGYEVVDTDQTSTVTKHPDRNT